MTDSPVLTPIQEQTALVAIVKNISHMAAMEGIVDNSPIFDELAALENGLRNATFAEPDSDTPGLEEFKDTVWNLYDSDGDITEAQHDFLVKWAETLDDRAAASIARQAEEDGREWTPDNATSSILSAMKSINPKLFAEYEALDEDDDDTQDEFADPKDDDDGYRDD